MALKAKNPITDALKNWIRNNFAPSNHNHGDIFDSRPDWSRCTEYQLHYDRIATKGNIYKINADGYLFFTDTRASHSDGGANTRDADGAIIASPAIEPLMRNNIDVTYDQWVLHHSGDEGSDNHATGMYPVDKSHPWFLRYCTTFNDILIFKMYFIPCKSQPTCEYLTLQYYPGNVATGTMYKEFNGNPVDAILPQNGYIIKHMNGKEYKYYAKVTETITLADGTKVPRYTYKYSVTGAATSGYDRYTWYTPPADPETGRRDPEIREVQGLDEIWIINCEDRWQLVTLDSYQDTAGTLMTWGDGTFSWSSICITEEQRLLDGVWTPDVTPWAASVKDENGITHYSKYFTRTVSPNYINGYGATERTYDYQRRGYWTAFSNIITMPHTQSISRFPEVFKSLIDPKITYLKISDFRSTPTLFPSVAGTTPFVLNTETGFVEPKETMNTDVAIYDGYSREMLSTNGTRSIITFGEHLFKAME